MGFNTPQNHNYIFKINDAEKFRFTSDSDSSSKIIINNPDTSLGQDQLIGGFEWKKKSLEYFKINIKKLNSAISFAKENEYSGSKDLRIAIN